MVLMLQRGEMEEEEGGGNDAERKADTAQAPAAPSPPRFLSGSLCYPPSREVCLLSGEWIRMRTGEDNLFTHHAHARARGSAVKGWTGKRGRPAGGTRDSS